MSSEKERRFQADLARIQVNVGVLTSVGVGLLTTSVAIGATTFSLGGIDSLEALAQYGAYYFLMFVLLIIGIMVLGSAKKFMNEQLNQLMVYGALQDSKPKSVQKKSRSNLSRLRRFWVCRGYNPEVQKGINTVQNLF